MKLAQFQEILATEAIDCVILTLPDPNITYFLEMEPSHASLVITPKEASVFLSKLDKDPQHELIKTKLLDKRWKDEIKSSKYTKVGINKEVLSLKKYEEFQTLFPNAEFVDISSHLAALRKEKTAEEVEKIKKACQVTSDAFAALVDELPQQTLKTEQDVALFLESYIRRQGCTLAFPTIAAVGENAAVPHHVTSTTQLTRGVLLVDFGARYEKYCADMTRSIFLGELTEKEKECYAILKKSQQAAIDAVKEGISFEELTTVSKKQLGEYSKYFIHSLGHGIGIEVHENPVFSQKEEKVTRNVPFTIEPGIYFSGDFGLRIEDTVVWDGKQLEILTSASKELIFIETF